MEKVNSCYFLYSIIFQFLKELLCCYQIWYNKLTILFTRQCHGEGEMRDKRGGSERWSRERIAADDVLTRYCRL